jgi:hypothetical protein
MKLAFLKIAELEGTPRHVRALLRYLEAKGVEVREFLLKQDNVQETVNELSEFQPIFTMDINGTGILFAEQEGKKVPFYDLFGVVHMSFFMEDPLLHFPQLLDAAGSRNLLALITDLRYIETLRMFGFQNISYITPFLDFTAIPEPSKERDLEVVFTGPVIDPQIIIDAARQNMDSDMFPYFLETGEFLFRNPEVNLLYAAEYVLSMFNPEFQQKFNEWRNKDRVSYLKLLNDIGIYATARKRWYVVSFLEGINLKIVGEFRGELREDHEVVNVSNHGELLEIFGRSHITITSFPHTVPTGIGFTPLEIAAMGSAPMLDFRGTLPAYFDLEREAISYMPLDRADIEEKILYFMDNLQEALQIGKAAQERVLSNFRVDDRGEFIFKMMNDILSQAKQEEPSEKTQE